MHNIQEIYRATNDNDNKIKKLDFGNDQADTDGMTTDALTDQKIAASEARSETKQVRLEGKMDLIFHSLTTLSTEVRAQRNEAASNRNTVIVAVIATGLGLAGLGYAALSYGAASFYNGTVVRDIVHNEAQVTTAPAKQPLTK